MVGSHNLVYEGAFRWQFLVSKKPNCIFQVYAAKYVQVCWNKEIKYRIELMQEKQKGWIVDKADFQYMRTAVCLPGNWILFVVASKKYEVI